MMRWLVSGSRKSKGLVVALGIGLVVLGFVQLRGMPRDSLPEFSPVTVQVQTEALGLSAEEVEQLVTVPLEQDLLNGVAFLDVIRSESLPGMSKIELIFEPGTDPGRARQVVNERLTQAAALPNVSRPPQMIQPLSSTSRLMMIGLSSEDRSLIDLGVLARWTIRPALMGIPGVANVSVWGQREQQLQVQVDPQELGEKGVSLDDVIRTTGNALWVSPLTFLEASTPGAGGFYDTSAQRIGVEHTQPIKTPEDLAGVTIERADDSGRRRRTARTARPPPQRLEDVATVVEDHQPLIGDAVFTDGPGLLIVVEKLPGANALEVTDKLDSAVDSLRPGLSDVEIDTSFFRPASYIDQSDDNLRFALILGIVLLVLVLGALLFDLRRVAVTLASILVSMSAAVLVLDLRGETINAMVLAGLVLALVIIIDDAISSAQDADSERSTLASRGPLAYATVIGLLVLVPMLVLHGEMGEFLPPLVLSYAAAVIASMLVALTFTPALGALVLTGGASRSPVIGRLVPRYQRVLSRFGRSALPAAIAVVVLLGLGLALAPMLDKDGSLVPDFEDRNLLVRLDAAPGTALPEMRRITARAGAELRSLPGVNSVGGHAGRAVLGDQAVGANSSELWVTIDTSAGYRSTVDAVEAVLDGYPGVRNVVSTYPQERIDDIIGDPDGVEGADLTVRIFGYELDVLRTQADEMRQLIAGVDGVEAPRVELPVEEPTLELEVDLERAQELGVKPGDVRRAAATVLSGIEVGNLFQDQKIFEVVVWGTPEVRRSVDDVESLLIDRPGGEQVRLAEVADVNITSSPPVIQHESVSRKVDIGIDVAGRDVDEVAGDIDDLLKARNFPLEYHGELLEDFEDRRGQRLTFVAVSVAVLVGVFLILQAAFSSWRLAAVGMVTLPAALVGGVLSTVVFDDSLTIGSVVGFVAVFGLATRHLIALVRRAHDREDLDGEEFGRALVLRAARDRFAPTFTSLVAVGAVFMGLVVAGGGAGREIVHPMAVVVVGGIVTSAIVSLFLAPVLYLRFGARPAESRERFDFELDLTDLEQQEPATTPGPVTA